MLSADRRTFGGLVVFLFVASGPGLRAHRSRHDPVGLARPGCDCTMTSRPYFPLSIYLALGWTASGIAMLSHLPGLFNLDRIP